MHITTSHQSLDRNVFHSKFMSLHLIQKTLIRKSRKITFQKIIYMNTLNELAPIIDVYVWFNQLIDWNWTRNERKKHRQNGRIVWVAMFNKTIETMKSSSCCIAKIKKNSRKRAEVSSCFNGNACQCCCCCWCCCHVQNDIGNIIIESVFYRI